MSENKAFVNMTNWELYTRDDFYFLSGTADNHPSLGKNSYVRASSLVSYIYEDEVLMYETRNTIYVCPLKYMTTSPYKGISGKIKEELTKRSKESDSPLDMIIEVAARISVIKELEETERDNYTIDDPEFYRNDFVTYVMSIQKKGQEEIKAADEAINMKLIEVAKQYEDCVYIEVSCVSSGSRLAYHLGEHTGVVEPHLHTGTFQDSVLYTKYGNVVALDFCYFPKGFLENVMETYSWSDNIACAVIKNDCSYRIEFNGERIEVGETKVFTKRAVHWWY